MKWPLQKNIIKCNLSWKVCSCFFHIKIHHWVSAWDILTQLRGGCAVFTRTVDISEVSDRRTHDSRPEQPPPRWRPPSVWLCTLLNIWTWSRHLLAFRDLGAPQRLYFGDVAFKNVSPQIARFLMPPPASSVTQSEELESLCWGGGSGSIFSTSTSESTPSSCWTNALKQQRKCSVQVCVQEEKRDSAETLSRPHLETAHRNTSQKAGGHHISRRTSDFFFLSEFDPSLSLVHFPGERRKLSIIYELSEPLFPWWAACVADTG